jgi:hypothetical protein
MRRRDMNVRIPKKLYGYHAGYGNSFFKKYKGAAI